MGSLTELDEISNEDAAQTNTFAADLFSAEEFQTTDLATENVETPNRFESRTNSPHVATASVERIVDEFHIGTDTGEQAGGHSTSESTDLAGVTRHATLPPPDASDTEAITEDISHTDTIYDSYTGYSEVINAETGPPQQDAIHNISAFTKSSLRGTNVTWTTVTRLTSDDLTPVEDHSSFQSSPSTSSFHDEQTTSESNTGSLSSSTDGETGGCFESSDGSLNLLVSDVVEAQISTEFVASTSELTRPGTLSTGIEPTSQSTPSTSVQKTGGLTTQSHTTNAQETSSVAIELRTTSGLETSSETTAGLKTSGETTTGLETSGETTTRLETYGRTTSDDTTTSRTTSDKVMISSQAAHIRTSAGPSGGQTSQETTRVTDSTSENVPTFPDKKLTSDAVHSSSANLPTASQTGTHHTHHIAHVSGTHRITESSLNTTTPYTYQPLGGKLGDVDGSDLSAKWMGLGAGVVALLIFFIVTIIVCSIKKKRNRESNGGNRFRFTGQSDLIMERYDQQTNKVTFHKKTNGLPSANLPKFESERCKVKDFAAGENFGTWRKKSMATVESFGLINNLPPEVDQDTRQDAMVGIYEKDSDCGSAAEVELRTFSAKNTCYKGFTHL